MVLNGKFVCVGKINLEMSNPGLTQGICNLIWLANLYENEDPE